MLTMVENNNEIFHELPIYDTAITYNCTISNVFNLFMKNSCPTCSSQSKVKKDEERMIAKVVNKSNAKVTQTCISKSTEPIPSVDPSEKVKHCALLILISILVYLNSIHGDFVHDDISAIVTNDDALGKSSIFSVFCNDFWGLNIRDRRSHKSYRPVTILSFR